MTIKNAVLFIFVSPFLFACFCTHPFDAQRHVKVPLHEFDLGEEVNPTAVSRHKDALLLV